MTARRKAKRCGHRYMTLLVWRQLTPGQAASGYYHAKVGDWLWFNAKPGEPRGAAVCRTCGSWLPLGPARDDGEHAEAVRIEVNAARWAAEHDVTNFADAWRCEAFSDAWLLAAEIATHDDTNGGEP